MGVHLHWSQANSFELVVRQNHGRPQGGGKTGICPSQLQIGTKNQNFLEILTSGAQFRSIYLLQWQFISRYKTHTALEPGSLFRCHCSGELAVHSFPLLCLQRQFAKLAIRLFYCSSLLCNNNMATNLLMFTSSDDIRHLAMPACDCWAQTSWQVMLWVSDC